jgi:hypothetical protein
VSARLLSRAAAPLLLALLLPLGCSADDDPPPPPPRPPVIAPHLDELSIPDFPPLGPKGTIGARCTDESALSSVTASFEDSAFRSVVGKEGTVSFRGEELGEGIGTLHIVCCDASQACAERTVKKFLVDLSPPEIAVDRIVASPTGEGFDGEIGVWARDAWVLGTVELTFRGTTLKSELPKAYPSTVGKEWDTTRIGFSAKELPLGSGTAVILAHDAAGNVTKKEIAIRIDGTAPVVAIAAPAAGAVVASGEPITVRLTASDADNPTPPTIELFVGGAPIGELNGPSAEIAIDTRTLPPGPTEIRAVARDDAGNRSVAAKVLVELQ